MPKAGEAELLIAVRQLLLAWMKWERDLLMCDEVWAGGLPRFTQELHDRYCALQHPRNDVITAIDRFTLDKSNEMV